jgi:hypothetical protein
MFETRGVPSDPSASQITNLSDEDLLRIRVALGNMPYSAMVHTRAVHDVDGLLVWLRSFAEVLRRHAERDEAAESERIELVRQRDAVRAFLGIDQIAARLDEVAPDPGFGPNL